MKKFLEKARAALPQGKEGWKALGDSAIDGAKKAPAASKQYLIQSWPRIKQFIQDLPALLATIPGRISAFFILLAAEGSKKLRMRTMLWSLVIAFLGISYLSGISPYRMLVPIWGIKMPIREKKTPVTIYGIGADGNLMKVVRRIELSDSIELNVKRLAVAVSERASIQDVDESSVHMPDLSLALKSIWVTKESECIVDLRASTLIEESEKFAKSRTSDAGLAAPYHISNYTRSFAASLLDGKSGCKSVRFLVDGSSSPKDIKLPFELKGPLNLEAVSRVPASPDVKPQLDPKAKKTQP